MSGSLANGSSGATGAGVVDQDRLRSVARARFGAAVEAPGRFFEARAGDLARACLDLAGAFHGGGRLLVAGTGGAISDALHVSVEFVHPVIVGKRALPALALTDAPADRVRVLADPRDVVLVFATGAAPEDDAAARRVLAAARERGATTIAMVGAGPDGWDADHVFDVDSEDSLIMQEVHETAYHVLWELVHVFLDHPEMLT